MNIYGSSIRFDVKDVSTQYEMPYVNFKTNDENFSDDTNSDQYSVGDREAQPSELNSLKVSINVENIKIPANVQNHYNFRA